MTPAHLSELIRLINDETISGKIAKQVMKDVFENGRTPGQIVNEKGLSQITDASEIESIVARVVR